MYTLLRFEQYKKIKYNYKLHINIPIVHVLYIKVQRDIYKTPGAIYLRNSTPNMPFFSNPRISKKLNITPNMIVLAFKFNFDSQYSPTQMKLALKTLNYCYPLLR